MARRTKRTIARTKFALPRGISNRLERIRVPRMARRFGRRSARWPSRRA